MSPYQSQEVTDVYPVTTEAQVSGTAAGERLQQVKSSAHETMSLSLEMWYDVQAFIYATELRKLYLHY